MRKLHLPLLAIVLFSWACKSTQSDPAQNAPNHALQWVRFDSAFFAIDTTHIAASIQVLNQKYPQFAPDFFAKILMLNTTRDTVMVKEFYKAYLPIYKQAIKSNAIALEQHAFGEAFKRIHYYFPAYPLTHNIIGFVGPLESYGNIITNNGLALGLQMYLGASSDWYFSERIQTIYPAYLSRRFSHEYLVANSVQNIINDIVPVPKLNGSLLDEMIEAGKRQYVLNACIPQAPDSVKFGFTTLQLNALRQQESTIWNYILHAKLTYSNLPSDIRSLMQEGVYSDVFGESIPGNAGKYIGYQIVAAWMQQKAQKEISMEALLRTPNDRLFAAAAYQP